jgi:hypothetical protein
MTIDPRPIVDERLRALMSVALAHVAFFIVAPHLELAYSLTVTLILAASASVDTLERCAGLWDLTCVDKVVSLTYGLIMLATVQTNWPLHLEEAGIKRLSERIERAMRRKLPMCFFGGSDLIRWLALCSP